MDLQTEHIAKYHKQKWMQKKEIQSRGKFHCTHYFEKHWKMLKFATKYKIKLTLMEKSIGFGTRWPTSNITYTDRRFIIFCISMPWYRVSMLTNKDAKKQTNIWSEFHDCFFHSVWLTLSSWLRTTLTSSTQVFPVPGCLWSGHFGNVRIWHSHTVQTKLLQSEVFHSSDALNVCVLKKSQATLTFELCYI